LDSQYSLWNIDCRVILSDYDEPVLFDAGATKGRWVTFFSIVAFPILALISIIAAWWFFKHGHYSAAKWVFTLPALSIIGFFVGFSMP
jgi:hypothetical protein